MPRRARTLPRLMAALAVVALALAPALAEARVGGGFGGGSRGGRTFTAPPATRTAPDAARPLQRTETPRPAAQAAAPGALARPGAATAARGGLMGGLLGAGLFGLILGAGLFGGLSGLAAFLGLALQIALIAGLAYLIVRLVRGRARPAPAMAGAMARGAEPPAARPLALGGGGPAPAAPLAVTPADFDAFERLLVEVNEAWSRADRAALADLATPEMARILGSDLCDLEARGWRNETRDLRLESGDLAEAWREDGQEYATVAMRFSLADWTRDASGAVVEGDPETRQTATELWTFLRRSPGGAWRLSAIQTTGR